MAGSVSEGPRWFEGASSRSYLGFCGVFHASQEVMQFIEVLGGGALQGGPVDQPSA